jgi:hypothetical protein
MLVAADTVSGGWILHTVLQPTAEDFDAAPDVANLLGDMLLAACAAIKRQYPGAELIGYTRIDNPKRRTSIVYLRHRIPRSKP